MNRNNYFKMVALSAMFSLAVWGSIAQAGTIDMLSCGVGNVNTIVVSEDLTVMAMDGRT